MRPLTSLDTHAHIDLEIPSRELAALHANVMAMTRSLAEFEFARGRHDPSTIWGVGVHPGLVRSHRAFDVGRFRDLLQYSPLVGEVGLDAKSRVPMDVQLQTFRAILEALQITPRIVSVRSGGATTEVIRELNRRPVHGVVLHWWLRSPSLTEEAVRLGCYFSVPPGATSREEVLEVIPKDRLLPETDHPSGDRFGPHPRRPGNVAEVEKKLGALLYEDVQSVRQLFWRNLNNLALETNTLGHFGPSWQSAFARSVES